MLVSGHCFGARGSVAKDDQHTGPVSSNLQVVAEPQEEMSGSSRKASSLRPTRASL